jgi:hypothetical protein
MHRQRRYGRITFLLIVSFLPSGKQVGEGVDVLVIGIAGFETGPEVSYHVFHRPGLLTSLVQSPQRQQCDSVTQVLAVLITLEAVHETISIIILFLAPSHTSQFKSTTMYVSIIY